MVKTAAARRLFVLLAVVVLIGVWLIAGAPDEMFAVPNRRAIQGELTVLPVRLRPRVQEALESGLVNPASAAHARLAPGPSLEREAASENGSATPAEAFRQTAESRESAVQNSSSRLRPMRPLLSRLMVGSAPPDMGSSPATPAGAQDPVSGDSSGSTDPTPSSGVSAASAVPTLTITTTSLPEPTAGKPYFAILSASGGTPPYSGWYVAFGQLPAGLALSSTGVISGTPTTVGEDTFVVVAEDSAGARANQLLSVVVAAAKSTSPPSSSAVRVLTNNLHLGDIDQPYTAALTAKGGSGSYTWNVSSGNLPPGLALDSSSGQISGTPTEGGIFNVTIRGADSSGASSSANFSLNIFEQPLDVYGGLVNMHSPKGGTGYFRVEKFGSRWMFVDPLGNAFWLLSVYSACPAPLHPSVSLTNWGPHLNERLKSWGFNTLGEFTSTCDSPIGTHGGSTYDSPRMPVIMIIGAVQDALFNPLSPAVKLPEAVKNISAGVPQTTWSGYRGALPDVYDPKFTTAYHNEVAYWMQQYTGGFADKSWILGITTDDADNLFGFKSGGDAPVNNYPNPAFLVATAQFQYTAAENPAGVPWIDPKLYSKYAWINFLKLKYANSIAALNAAWGTGGFYTSFDDAGGYGIGTGVIDEDGRHTAWMGNDPFMLNGTRRAYGTACANNCISASAGVQADINAFLYQFVKEYATVAVAAIRAVDKNHLIFGPAAINNYGAKARDQVLQGLSDGGIDVFQFNYDPAFGPQAGSMAQNDASYNLTKKPAFIWYSVIANPDSTLSGEPPPYGEYDFPTQAARAQHYSNVDIPNFLNAKGADGDYYVLGIDWWDVYDDHTQNTNWGLITNSDNAYDGKAARIASGMDSWGFTTGGEAANYGDFLDGVTQANLNALRHIVAGR